MYKNIIQVFSFLFISRDLRMGRAGEGRIWLSLPLSGATVQFFCENYQPFCFVLPGSKSSLVYIIFQTLTKILVVIHRAYKRHVSVPLSRMSPSQFTRDFLRGRTCFLFTWGKRCNSCYATNATYVAFLPWHLLPICCKQQVHFLLCHPRNLHRMRKVSDIQHE